MWRLPFDHEHIPDADSETGKVHYCENQKLEAHSEGYIYGKTQPWVGGRFKPDATEWVPSTRLPWGRAHLLYEKVSVE